MNWLRIALLVAVCPWLVIAQLPDPSAIGLGFKVSKAASDPVKPRLFVVPDGANSLEVLDINVRDWVGRIEFQFAPEAVAITPNGRWMYVALKDAEQTTGGPGAGYIAEIDLSDLSVKKTFAIPLDPSDVIATDGGVLIVAGALNEVSEVASFNAETGAKLDSISGVGSGLQLALHPIQEFFYGSDQPGLNAKIHHFPLSAQGDIGVPWHGPESDLNQVGGEVYVLPTGTQVISQTGNVFSSSAEEAGDLNYLRRDVPFLGGAAFDPERKLMGLLNAEGLHVFDYMTAEKIGYTAINGAGWLGFVDGRFVAITTNLISVVAFYVQPARNEQDNSAPMLTFDLSSTDSLFAVGQEVYMTARAVDLDGAVLDLKLFQGTNEVESVNHWFISTGVPAQPGTNEFYAVAVDTWNARSTSAVKRVVGNYAPTVSVVEPSESFSTVITPEVVVRAEASDRDGSVAEVRLKVNGGDYTVDHSAPYEFLFMPPANGSYNLIVEAVDDVGLKTSVERTVLLTGPADDYRYSMPGITDTNVTLIVSTSSATRQKGEPNHAGVTGGKSVWLSWTAPGGSNSVGTVTIDTLGSDFDTLLAVYRLAKGEIFSTTTFTNLLLVAANDDDPVQPPSSRVKFTPTPGGKYYIAIDGREGVAGNARLSIAFKPSGAPENDYIAKAVRLFESSPPVSGSNVGASKEAGEPNHAGNVGGASLWYRFSGQSGGEIQISTLGSAIDTIVAVYAYSGPITFDPPTPASVSGLTLVAANDDGIGDTRTSLVRFRPSFNFATYYVAVDGYNGEQGDIRIQVTRPTITGARPLNDFFTNAFVLVGSAVITNGTSRFATIEPSEPQHNAGRWGASVWYKWVAPNDGAVVISTKGSDFDTVLGVYMGTDIASLARMATNDDDPAGLSSSAVIFNAVEGTEYRIAVAGYVSSGAGPAAGNLVLAINQTAAFVPRLVSQWLGAQRQLALSVANGTEAMMLEASADLLNWEPIVVLLPSETKNIPAVGGERQFYRLKSLH